MEKIDTKIIKNIENINLKDYFIMPYYSNDSLIYVKITKESIKWYNNDLKNITPYKRINNALKKMYISSKFYGYEIYLICFLSKRKQKTSLIVFDLLLKDEIEKKIQSKKYSIRLDNIKNRFIDLKNKFIIPIFAQKNENNEINDILLKMIESNSWDGFIFYKDKPYNYDLDNTSLFFYKLWEIKSGQITNYEVSLNENNEPFISCIYISNDELGSNIKISGNIAEIQKYKPNEIELINKKILFKYCILKNDDSVTIITNFLKFD